MSMPPNAVDRAAFVPSLPHSAPNDLLKEKTRCTENAVKRLQSHSLGQTQARGISCTCSRHVPPTSWCEHCVMGRGAEKARRVASREGTFFFSWIILSSMLKEKGAVQHTHTQQPSVCSAQALLCDLRSQYLGLVPSWTFGVSNLLQFTH